MDSVQDYLIHDDGDAQEKHLPEAEASARIKLPEWLTARTGPGPVEDYINHPLNFVKSPGIAQVIRGFAGMFNKLDYAIIDILIGGLRFFATRQRGGAELGP